MATSKEDIMQMDLYGILGVNPEASEREIVKAYRKRALKCHPDKNPDNPRAAELFHELSKALGVLTDPSAKAAYDSVQKAKKVSEARHRELDSKRRKLKDDLEARERWSVGSEQRDNCHNSTVKHHLLAEVERLRKEGSKLLEQEQQRMKEQMKNSVDDDSDSDCVEESPKIKIRWNAKRFSGYDEEDLSSLFGRYGQIANIIVSSKKKGSAIIEFECYAPMLKLAENERGIDSSPLTVTWLSGKPSSTQSTAENLADKQTSSSAPISTAPLFSAAAPSSQSSRFGLAATSVSGTDFESLVLMKMRQAEERKRLIEQMQKEEEDEEETKHKS